MFARSDFEHEAPKSSYLFWTLGSTARLVMHECAVVRNSAVAQGRSSADTANKDISIYLSLSLYIYIYPEVPPILF